MIRSSILRRPAMLGCALVFAVSVSSGAIAGSYGTLYKFQGGSDGGIPSGSLLVDSSGNLYGTTTVGGKLTCHAVFETDKGCGVAFKFSSSGSETILHTFKGLGTSTDGAAPVGGLVQDSSGNFFGATVSGGASSGECLHGCGTVYKLTASGKETVLYSFAAGNDGYGPTGGVILDSSGNLYGSTLDGGSGSRCDGDAIGCGIVFKLTSKGSEKILHAFAGGSSDGSHPTGSLYRDSSGNLFGTTGTGGSNDSCGTGWTGCGTVFKIASNGTETLLHNFTGGSDGAYPVGGLIADSSGNLYGSTAAGGGTDNCGAGSYGCGTVFKIASNGTETILHSFTGGTDGAYPFAALLIDSAGNLYGETAGGGSTASCGITLVPKGSGCGVLYKIAANGTETVLHVFKGVQKADGAEPFAGLAADSAGELYGVTFGGGVKGCASGFDKSGCGTVFKANE